MKKIGNQLWNGWRKNNREVTKLLNKIICECESFDEKSNQFNVELEGSKIVVENFDIRLILDLQTFKELKTKINEID